MAMISESFKSQPTLYFWPSATIKHVLGNPGDCHIPLAHYLCCFSLQRFDSVIPSFSVIHPVEFHVCMTS